MHEWDTPVNVLRHLAQSLLTLKPVQTMLKVEHDDDRQSRTSLASLFEDLASLRKSFLARGRSQDTSSQRCWIERTFFKRECCRFIRSPRDPTKCSCGRGESWHTNLPKSLDVDSSKERWHPYRHTEAKPTNAYGCLEFQGAPHPSKAQYLRLSSYDTKADQVLHLLQDHWGLDLPKLLITVHGGILNFDLQPKLKRVFRKGLLKAAKTTGAWIITGGTNTGVTRHVGDAISDRTLKAKNKIVAIGIAPWGIVENKEDLIGKDITVPYHCVSSPKTNYSVLNSNHSYFLLVDNGTTGKYGGEIIFRKRLEKYIASQKICITSGVKGRGVPVICVVLEGGANTIRSVLEYVTDSPPIPVVVCDGSGRAADLLAFTHKYILDDGTMPESLRDQLILTIEKTFQYSQEQAEKLFIELMLCVKKKELITVFRMGEGAQDIDLAILTALLKGTNASAPDQLSLALTWDRVDIARSHIFVYGQEWPEGSLEQAMMDALINDRVDFVKLLLENGVHMQTFLTIPRLEELYNTRQGPSNTLRYLVRDVRKHFPSGYRYTLPDIGLVIQHLMGGAFRSNYCRKRFRQKYNALKRNGTATGNLGNLVTTLPTLVNIKEVEDLFPYPFHDLMIWAILMKRQKMALFMWQHGEEAMAKALLATKLYKAMAHEADQDDLEVEIPDELRSYAREFQTLALDLLEHCYKIDDDHTQQLLTYELKNFSDQTCLSLAVAAAHRQFIAHTCCQILLNDMWMGGLRMRKSTTLKVILCMFFPPYILALEFKSKEELQLMPQTMEEHLDELEDNESEMDNVSVSSFDEDHQNDFDEIESSFVSQTNVKENGTLIQDVSAYSTVMSRSKKSPLRLGKKIYEFYNAPITKFWAHTMSYLAFLMMYTYVVLVRTLERPRWQEYYVMGYIFSLAIEKIRQIIASEPAIVCMKFKVFLAELWNIWDTVAILLFTSGAVMHHIPFITPKAVRVVYTVNIVFWYIRILEILSVNKYLGPYVKIIGKLVRDMSYFIIILLIVLASFGVVRQSIHFQEEEPSWQIVRNMFFYPYWMIYGELFADEIDTCTDPLRDGCVYGSWVAPALMCAYLLVANILLVNLLIARFNATFIRNNANSREIWKFQRYQLIINYELRPILPPPLMFLSHIYLALKFIKRRCQGKRDIFDNGLKLFLTHEDTEKLHDFEEECAEDYFREKEQKFQSSADERIRVINERSENMNLRMDDMIQKENSIKLSLQTVDYRLSLLEEIAQQSSETLTLLKTYLSRQLRTRNISASSDRSSRGKVGSQESLDLGQFDDIGESSMDIGAGRASQLDLSDKPSTPDAALKSMPSPILVHSKKTLKTDLSKFTDYTKPPTKRRTLERKASSKSRQSLPKLLESSPELLPASSTGQVSPRSPHLRHLRTSSSGFHSQTPTGSEQSLYERRQGFAQLHIDTDAANQLNDVMSTPAVVSVNDPTVSGIHVGKDDENQSAALYSIARSHSDTRVSSRLPRQNEVQSPAEGPSFIVTPADSNVTENPLANPDVLNVIAASERLPTSVVTPFTPILTPLRAEYTTITDEIDTTCMINRTPPRSPTSGNAFFGESVWDDEDRAENEATKTENAILRQAEETEHRKMERVIQHRLRQISMDESNSISDIARLVISEMDGTEDVHSEHEDAEDDMQASTESINMSIRIKIRGPSQDTESPNSTV